VYFWLILGFFTPPPLNLYEAVCPIGWTPLTDNGHCPCVR